MSAKVEPYSNKTQAMKLNRAAAAFKELKNAEKQFANAQRHLNRKKEEYHRITRLLLYPQRIRIRNNSKNLTPNEARGVITWRNMIRNARRAGRTLNAHLPNNMIREVKTKIKEEYLRR